MLITSPLETKQIWRNEVKDSFKGRSDMMEN